jgi:Terminase RNaseH-like domain
LPKVFSLWYPNDRLKSHRTEGYFSLELLFGEKRDPVSRLPLDNPGDYDRMFLNPADNAINLSPEYLKSLERLPERQRKRFFEGAYVDDLENALFSYEVIARTRVTGIAPAQCSRVVVAVDPSGASSREDERADEIGIVVAARGQDGHAYILEDRSLRDAPAVWGRVAVQAYHEYGADRIIAEENFGGEMVKFVILAADAGARVSAISASRGKVLRAEPVSALYEQGLVHHVGRLGVLEDQLCAFTTAGYRGEGSPDHADALVFAVTELLLKESVPIIEYYRQQTEERQQEQADAPRPADPTVRLRAPDGLSVVHGSSGALYIVGANRVVAVKAEDAVALLAHGCEPVAEAGG